MTIREPMSRMDSIIMMVDEMVLCETEEDVRSATHASQPETKPTPARDRPGPPPIAPEATLPTKPKPRRRSAPRGASKQPT